MGLDRADPYIGSLNELFNRKRFELPFAVKIKENFELLENKIIQI